MPLIIFVGIFVSLLDGLLKYSASFTKKKFNLFLLASSYIVLNSFHISPVFEYLLWLPVNYCLNSLACYITHCAIPLCKPYFLYLYL